MVSAQTIVAVIIIGAFFFFGGGKFIKPALSAAKEVASDVRDISSQIKSKAEQRADDIRETMP